MPRDLGWHELEENHAGGDRFLIRFAEAADLPALVAMGMEAMTTIPRYKGVLTPSLSHMRKYFESMLSNQEVFFVVLGPPGEPYGMLGAVCFVNDLSGAKTVADHFWWVQPGKRGRGLYLLKAFFAWGESIGVTTYQLGSSSRRVSKLYKRFGFQRTEEVYMKRVN
jgi:GNAT superfamily N-acetyltransferase